MVTVEQKKQAKQLVDDVIVNLPPAAIRELLQGYEQDYNYLLDSMLDTTIDILDFPRSINMEETMYLEALFNSMHTTLQIKNYNYFKTTVLNNFRQNWRNIEWGSLVQLYNYVAFLCQRDRDWETSMHRIK